MHKQINIDCKLFETKINVHIADNFDIIESLYKVNLDEEDKKAKALAFDYLEDYRCFLMVLKTEDIKNLISRNIVHESIHLKNYMFERYGVIQDPNNDEFEAYFVDNLYNEILAGVLEFSKNDELTIIETYI